MDGSSVWRPFRHRFHSKIVPEGTQMTSEERRRERRASRERLGVRAFRRPFSQAKRHSVIEGLYVPEVRAFFKSSFPPSLFHYSCSFVVVLRSLCSLSLTLHNVWECSKLPKNGSQQWSEMPPRASQNDTWELQGRSWDLSATSWGACGTPKYQFESSRGAPGSSLESFKSLLRRLWARFLRLRGSLGYFFEVF